jgi:hypothetical protein
MLTPSAKAQGPIALAAIVDNQEIIAFRGFHGAKFADLRIAEVHFWVIVHSVQERGNAGQAHSSP